MASVPPINIEVNLKPVPALRTAADEILAWVKDGHKTRLRRPDGADMDVPAIGIVRLLHQIADQRELESKDAQTGMWFHAHASMHRLQDETDAAYYSRLGKGVRAAYEANR